MNPAPDRMARTSKIVAFGIEFQDALRAALAIAGNKKPYDVVQLRIDSLTSDLMIYSRDGGHNLAVGISVGTTMVDVIADRDEVIEITKSDARALSAMKIKKEEGRDEEDPMVGLIISEQSITRTDETGLGLGIRQCRVRRTTWPGEKLALGNVPDMLRAASDALPGEFTTLTTHQMKVLGTASAALDINLNLFAMEPSGDYPTRVYITGAGFQGFAATDQKKVDTPDTDDQDTGTPTFDDVPLFPDLKTTTEKLRDDGVKLSIVTSRPAGGIA